MGAFSLPSAEKLETFRTVAFEGARQKEELNEASLMPTDTPPQNVSSLRLLPLSAILAEFGLKNKTTIYGLIRQRKFPPPIKIGGSSRWIADEIEAYKAECKAECAANRRGPVPRRAESSAA